MKSIERIEAAVRFAKTDCLPVVPQIFGHAAVLAGVKIGEYVRDGDLLARCQIEALKRYGYDAVFAFMDLSVETEAAGSVLKYYENQYPDVISYALSPNTALDNLSIPDPHHMGRMPEMLRAAAILRREVGDDVLVVGSLVGPMTLATQLAGLESTLYLAADSPDRFEKILDFATEIGIRYGLAQIEAGAHLPMVFDPSASPAVVPHGFFHTLLLPRLKRLFSAFAQAGAVANWLNIAGPTQTILPYYPDAGVNIANFDYYVDPLLARRILPDTCLEGNIKPLSFVLESPDVIAAEASRLRDVFADRGGFLLSSGCEIPPESRPENIAAMVSAARARE